MESSTASARARDSLGRTNRKAAAISAASKQQGMINLDLKLAQLKLQNAPDYASALLKYGSLSRHPLVAGIVPELRNKVLNCIALSRAAGFCYFRIPKAANSTIILSLLNNMPGNRCAETNIRYAKQSLHGIPAMDELNRLFKFTFVRHPASRCLSAFLDKCRAENLRRAYPCLSGEPGTANGFRYFLDGLQDGQLMDNLHWAPQTKILPYDFTRYDFVGKFENLEADLTICLSRLFDGTPQIHSVFERRTDAASRVNDYLGKRERDQIARLYEADFEAFYPDGK